MAGRKIRDFSNTQKGDLLVLEPIRTRDKNDRIRIKWRCECKCGKSCEVSSSTLSRPYHHSCGCRDNAKENNHKWRGYRKISGNEWNSIIRHAKIRNLGVFITIEDIWTKIVEQDFKCAISGFPLQFKKSSRDRETQNKPSLDRIDSSKDYTIDNIQWVHKQVNLMKKDLNQDEFVNWCKLVADYNTLR